MVFMFLRRVSRESVFCFAVVWFYLVHWTLMHIYKYECVFILEEICPPRFDPNRPVDRTKHVENFRYLSQTITWIQNVDSRICRNIIDHVFAYVKDVQVVGFTVSSLGADMHIVRPWCFPGANVWSEYIIYVLIFSHKNDVTFGV